MSLELDVSHGDHPIAALEGRLENSHWPLKTGAVSLRAQNTVLIGPETAVVVLGEV